jgi:hypothetical protein
LNILILSIIFSIMLEPELLLVPGFDGMAMWSFVSSSLATSTTVCEEMWASGTKVYIRFSLPTCAADMSVLPVPSLTLILGASACPVSLTMGPLILVSSENLERKKVYCSQNRIAAIALLVAHHGQTCQPPRI